MPEFAALLNGYKRFKEYSYPRQKARFDELSKDGQQIVEKDGYVPLSAKLVETELKKLGLN